MKIKEFRKINKCRLCNSKKIIPKVNFGKLPLGNNLMKNKDLSLKAKKYPLGLSNCIDCGHFQLSHEVNQKLLYDTNYTYLTGISSSFIDHFKDYVLWIKNKCKLDEGSKVLDIGSNDGTCLKAFHAQGFKVVGIDPAKLPTKQANQNKIRTYNDFFDKKSLKILLSKEGKFDLITSHNVFAHISDIQSVFKNTYILLKKDGYLSFEIGYFIKVLKNNLFDTIYHEHLDYHHAEPLVKLLLKIGFSVIFINQNKIQGGSIRILCKKEFKPRLYANANSFLKKERKSLKNLTFKIRLWEKEIFLNLNKVKNYINKKKQDSSKVIAYGAPTKATLLLKLSNLDSHNHIEYILEDNNLKVNRYLPGTQIKIKKFNEIYKKKPDVIIILAWNFLDDILKKFSKHKMKNIQLIVPLPKFKVINI